MVLTELKTVVNNNPKIIRRVMFFVYIMIIFIVILWLLSYDYSVNESKNYVIYYKNYEVNPSSPNDKGVLIESIDKLKSEINDMKEELSTLQSTTVTT